MKKVFSSLFLIAFLMSSNALENKSSVEFDDCFSYAYDAAYWEWNHYGGTTEDYVESFLYYESICEEAGGSDNLLSPVFL